MAHWTEHLPDFNTRHRTVSYLVMEIESNKKQIAALQEEVRQHEKQIRDIVSLDYNDEEIDQALQDSLAK